MEWLSGELRPEPGFGAKQFAPPFGGLADRAAVAATKDLCDISVAAAAILQGGDPISKDPKKKTLFLLIGPPSVAP